MKKRILSVLLAFAMIFTLMPTALAAPTTYQVVTVDKTTVQVGETVNVKVTLPAGIETAGSFTVDLKFDKDKFEVQKFKSVATLSATDGDGEDTVVAPVKGTVATANEQGALKVNAAYTYNTIQVAGVTVIDATLKAKASGVANFSFAIFEITKSEGGTQYIVKKDQLETPPSVTIPKAPITSVTIADLDAPVKGAAPDASVTVTPAGLTADVMWFDGETPVTGNFAASTAYTVKIKLTASGGDNFAETVTASGYDVTRNSATELLLTKTFPKTNDKDTPVCVAPTGVTATFGSALSTITLTNPTGNTAGKWYWMDDAQKVGNVKDNPHTYKAKFVPNDTANFSTVENIDVTVTATQVVLNAGYPIMIPIEVYYTGSAIEPTPTIKTDNYGDELVLNQDYKITKYEDNTNVGTGKIFIAPLTNGNYSFTAGSYTFTIKAGTSSISITGDPSKPYDGNVVTDPAVSKSGSTGAVTYTYYTDAACTTKTTTASGAASDGAAPKNAGDYWVKATLAADSNYGSATSVAKKFTISQKALTNSMITLGTQNTYNGTEQRVQIASVKDGTASLIAGGYDYSIVSGNKATDVGNNTLVIEGKGNYKGTARATWSLVARDVTITPDAKSKTYGATDPTLTYTTDIDGDATLKGKFDTAKSGKLLYTGTDVGTYPITLGTLKAGNNFNLKLAAATVNFTINQATPSITATSPRQLVKNDVEVDITGWASFDNTDSGAKLTYALDGAPAGITLTTDNKLKAADDASTVSTFNIKVNAAATTNFAAPSEKVIVVNVVTKSDAGVSITTPPTSKTYGDANFSLAATKTAPNGGTWSWNSSNPAILEIVSGADTATPTIKVKKADTAGATLTVTYTSSTHYGSANATITVAPKTLTAADLTHSGPITKVYDTNTNAPTGLTVSVKSGSLVGTDTLAVTGTLKYNSANVNEANKITFTPDAITTGNYALAASEVLTITGAKITQATPTYTVPTGLTAKYGQTLADVNIAATTGWSWMNTGTAVGTPATKNFPAKFTPTDAINYKTVENIDASVAVSKADAPTLTNITVSQKYTVDTEQSKNIGTAGMPADAGTLTYTKGTESKTGSVTVTSWAVDATGKVTYTLSGGAAGNTVTLPVTIGSNNYADATVNVVITIIKATPTGEPAYTKITTSGKTLADAALGVGTIKPNAGTLVWVDDAENVLPGDTEVKANTNYKWRFTPTDTNYESISGTIKLWSKSSGGSGSYYPAGITFTTDLPVGTINRVAVNGKTLDSKNYVVNGSDVTLLQSYLATLKAGKYTVKIENKTHVSTGTFTIKADGTLSSPKTADAGVCLYAAMALMSGTGAAYVTLRRKKEN